MTRTRWLAALLTIVLCAAPTAAVAKSGWLLPKVKGQQGITSKAWHCGKGEFGTYRFKNATTVNGRSGYVIYKVEIAANGSTHKPRFKRFGGHLPQRLRERTLKLLKTTRYRYVPGKPALVESVFADGRVQATRPFNPVRVKNARC
jgi:hypothetical protein